MIRRLVLLPVAAVCFTGLAQSQPAAPQAAAGGPAGAGSWFRATQPAAGVWTISDNGSDNVYLVEGRDKALLIDTGLGVARLSALVKTLTAKPLLVVNTHGHPDHAGGNFEFASVYAHPADFSAIRGQSTKEARTRAVQNAAKGAARSDMITLDEAAQADSPELLPVKDGYVFDLGGRKLEVIESPGHTPGEIVLLDAANKAIFTGDNSNTLVWLFLPNSEPLEVYLQSLKKLQRRTGEFTTVYPGHGAPLPNTFVGEQIACVESILDGSASERARPYSRSGGVPTGNALVVSHQAASVAYNPQNLRVKK
jgi:glyoxylase-like metal-dependent hydrolase (beta-lactamase superfamily II)